MTKILKNSSLPAIATKTENPRNISLQSAPDTSVSICQKISDQSSFESPESPGNHPLKKLLKVTIKPFLVQVDFYKISSIC